jgi:hypothetical protein
MAKKYLRPRLDLFYELVDFRNRLCLHTNIAYNEPYANTVSHLACIQKVNHFDRRILVHCRLEDLDQGCIWGRVNPWWPGNTSLHPASTKQSVCITSTDWLVHYCVANLGSLLASQKIAQRMPAMSVGPMVEYSFTLRLNTRRIARTSR